MLEINIINNPVVENETMHVVNIVITNNCCNLCLNHPYYCRCYTVEDNRKNLSGKYQTTPTRIYENTNN